MNEQSYNDLPQFCEENKIKQESSKLLSNYCINGYIFMRKMKNRLAYIRHSFDFLFSPWDTRLNRIHKHKFKTKSSNQYIENLVKKSIDYGLRNENTKSDKSSKHKVIRISMPKQDKLNTRKYLQTTPKPLVNKKNYKRVYTPTGRDREIRHRLDSACNKCRNKPLRYKILKPKEKESFVSSYTETDSNDMVSEQSSGVILIPRFTMN